MKELYCMRLSVLLKYFFLCPHPVTVMCKNLQVHCCSCEKLPIKIQKRSFFVVQQVISPCIDREDAKKLSHKMCREEEGLRTIFVIVAVHQPQLYSNPVCLSVFVSVCLII